MNGRPVFGNKTETEEWEAVQRIDRAKDKVKALSDIIVKITLSDGPVHSAILTDVINRVAEHNDVDDWENILKDMVAKKRPQDTRPVLAAAEYCVKMGRADLAKEYLDTVKETSDVPMACVAWAKYLDLIGDAKGAVRQLYTAISSDPCCREAYLMLEKLDPENDWEDLMACECIWAKEPFDEPPEKNTPEHDLYGIYREWFVDGGEKATHAQTLLTNHKLFNEGESMFLTVRARMAVSERDWTVAEKMYSAATAGRRVGPAMLCEIAEMYAAQGDYGKALSKYRDAEASDPGSARVAMGLIDSYTGLGKVNEAVEVTKEFLPSETSGYDAYLHVADILLKKGYLDEAYSNAESVFTTYPNDCRTSVLLSRISMARGDTVSARNQAKDAVHADPKDPEALAHMSKVCLAGGDIKSAVKYGRKAVKYGPSNVNAHISLMEAYRQSGDSGKTISECQAVLALDGSNTEASDTLASLQFEASQRTRTEDLSSKIEGEDAFVQKLSDLIAAGDYDEALTLCSTHESQFGGLAIVRRLRGNAEYALGQYAKASASYASAVAVQQDAETWYSKGMADEALGDLESAESSYDRAIMMDIKNDKYWISKGCVQEKKGDRAEAVKSFNRAIELNPVSSYALARKAAIFAEEGRYEDALHYLSMAGMVEPNNDAIYALRMKICLKASRYREVIDIGTKLLRSKSEPDDTIVYCIVQAYIGSGDTSGAEKVLEKPLRNNPESEILMRASRDLYVAMSRNDEIIQVCRALLRVAPHDRVTKKDLADALFRTGKGEEAASIYASLSESASSEKIDDAGSMKDPEANMAVARSLMEARDYVGAGKMADRALNADPNNTDYILFRASLYRVSDSARIAEAYLSQNIQRNPAAAPLYVYAGDLRVEEEDYEGAIEAYNKAMEKGIKSASLYDKLGAVQKTMGRTDAAMQSYEAALRLDPKDDSAGKELAKLQISKKMYDKALMTIDNALAVHPSSDGFAIKAAACRGLKDREGVKDAYSKFIAYPNPAEEDVRAVIAALNSVNLRSEADSMKDGISQEAVKETHLVPQSVMRTAERIMRRAYMMGLAIDDQDVLDAIDNEESEAAVAYLKNIPEYGEVVYGAAGYERMEALSRNALVRSKAEKMSDITVEKAYMAGGARDAEEAKLLVGYIRSCPESKLPREIPDEYASIVPSVTKKDTPEQVMRDMGVGYFGARIILSAVE